MLVHLILPATFPAFCPQQFPGTYFVKKVKCSAQEENNKTLAKVQNLLSCHFTSQYFLVDNFLYNSHHMPHWQLIDIEREVRFYWKREGKRFIPGRSMLSILTDANRRDSANAGGGDWRPSSRSLSGSFCSPWITANPSRNRSAKDVALKWSQHDVNKTEL